MKVLNDCPSYWERHHSSVCFACNFVEIFPESSDYGQSPWWTSVNNAVLSGFKKVCYFWTQNSALPGRPFSTQTCFLSDGVARYVRGYFPRRRSGSQNAIQRPGQHRTSGIAYSIRWGAPWRSEYIRVSQINSRASLQFVPYLLLLSRPSFNRAYEKEIKIPNHRRNVIFTISSQPTNFHETRYERHAVTKDTSLRRSLLSNFVRFCSSPTRANVIYGGTARTYMQRFSRNSKMVNNITSGSFAPNFTPVGQ